MVRFGSAARTPKAAGIVQPQGSRHSGGTRFFSSRRFLRAFQEAARCLLPTLSAVVPIDRIEARIEGEILEGDGSVLLETQRVSGERD